MKYLIYLFMAALFASCCKDPDPIPSIDCPSGFEDVDGVCRCRNGVPYGEFNCIDPAQKYYVGTFDCGCPTEVLIYFYGDTGSPSDYSFNMLYRDTSRIWYGGWLFEIGNNYYKGVDDEYHCTIDDYLSFANILIEYPVFDDTLRGTLIMEAFDRGDEVPHPISECDFAFPLYMP